MEQPRFVSVTFPKFLHIGGCPRSGTSLLSSLIGNLPEVNVTQDLCLFYYLKCSAMKAMDLANGVLNDANLVLSVQNRLPEFDLRETEFFPRYMSLSPEACLNDFHGINGRVLRGHVEFIDSFLFDAYNRPDPRKDRGIGGSYLRRLDLASFMDSDSMKESYRNILLSSSFDLGKNKNSQLEVLCEKTPENAMSLDVLDLCAPSEGFSYIHLVRDPVSVYGARKQRLDSGPKNFAAFFKQYSLPSLPFGNCRSHAFVRYEDLVREPETTLISTLKELNLLKGIDNTSIDFTSFDPGKYTSYVGNSLDLGRDASNRSVVSLEDSVCIYESLNEFCERFSYGPYSGNQ